MKFWALPLLVVALLMTTTGCGGGVQEGPVTGETTVDEPAPKHEPSGPQ